MTRLDEIAGLVPGDARAAADIGYDHGKLILRLAESHPQLQITGVEKQHDASARFWRVLGESASLRSRVSLVHGDGLEPLRGQETEVIVLAGLGERRIVDVLERGRDVVGRVKRMVFGPLDTRAILRPYLRSIGWSPVAERLIKSRGRFYQVFAAERGDPPVQPDTWLIGTDLFHQRHPLLPEFLQSLHTTFEPLAARSDDAEQRIPMFAAAIERIMAGLERQDFGTAD